MLCKNEIIKIVSDMNLPSDKYWITAGAGLVIHGVKEFTNDIDIGVTTDLADYLVCNGYKFNRVDDGTRIIKINENLEALENWFVEEIISADGLPVASLESIKKQKIELGREKDIKDINMIEKYIENKGVF